VHSVYVEVVFVDVTVKAGRIDPPMYPETPLTITAMTRARTISLFLISFMICHWWIVAYQSNVANNPCRP